VRALNRAALALIFAAVLPASLGAMELKQVLDVQLGLGYAGIQGGPGSLNFPGRLLYLPLLKLGEGDYLAPVFLADYQYRGHEVTEDAFFVSSLMLVAKPTWKHLMAGGHEASVFGSAKRNVTQERFDQPWSLGLYDYEEYGGGLGYRRAGFLGLQSLGLDLGLAHRSYGNYHNPAPAPSGHSENYYLKDMLIPSLDLHAAFMPAERGVLKLDYSLASRLYTDASLVLDNNFLGADRRSDLYQSVELKAFKDGGFWSRSLSLGADYNLSNQNYWDRFFFLYFEDFYSYYSIHLRPEISWLPQGKASGHRLSLAYEALLLNYLHRNIRNPDGSKTAGAEGDVEHHFSLNGTYVINRWLNLVGGAVYVVARSNQGYAPTVHFSYDLFNGQLGLEAHF
jgi:hypothetical protein